MDRFKRMLIDLITKSKELDRQKAELLSAVKNETFKTVEKTGEWNITNFNKYGRLNKNTVLINNEMNKAMNQEIKTISNHLNSTYKDRYIETMKAVGKEPKSLDNGKIKSLIEEPWSGASFKERIQVNNGTLKFNVKGEITQSAVKQEQIKEIGKRIDKRIEQSKNSAKRILDTENTRVIYEADKQAFNDAGIKRVKYNAAFDHSCSECSANHGKVYDLGSEPSLPRHSNCRCFYEPITEE